VPVAPDRGPVEEAQWESSVLRACAALRTQKRAATAARRVAFVRGSLSARLACAAVFPSGLLAAAFPPCCQALLLRIFQHACRCASVHIYGCAHPRPADARAARSRSRGSCCARASNCVSFAEGAPAQSTCSQSGSGARRPTKWTTDPVFFKTKLCVTVLTATFKISLPPSRIKA
jgi:hypothetical protein